MPRPQKPLEEQLQAAEEELKKYEEKVVQCKQNIISIKQQIDDRDMRKAFSLLKKNNVSVDQLERLLKNK